MRCDIIGLHIFLLWASNSNEFKCNKQAVVFCALWIVSVVVCTISFILKYEWKKSILCRHAWFSVASTSVCLVGDPMFFHTQDKTARQQHIQTCEKMLEFYIIRRATDTNNRSAAAHADFATSIAKKILHYTEHSNKKVYDMNECWTITSNHAISLLTRLSTPQCLC